MRDALNRTGRPIFYSACEWGEMLPALWFRSVANSWRTTGDIVDTWLLMLLNIDINNLFASFAAPHGNTFLFLVENLFVVSFNRFQRSRYVRNR